MPKVRVIGPDGEQLGILSTLEALRKAEELGLDLVEVAPNAVPPVCKIADYGKMRYDQTKREKESKKAQHQIKVKEVKLRPATDKHDLETKRAHAEAFLRDGCKVKITCTLRGREQAHPEYGVRAVEGVIAALSEWGAVEGTLTRMGRVLSVVIAPVAKKGSAKRAAMPTATLGEVMGEVMGEITENGAQEQKKASIKE